VQDQIRSKIIAADELQVRNYQKRGSRRRLSHTNIRKLCQTCLTLRIGTNQRGRFQIVKQVSSYARRRRRGTRRRTRSRLWKKNRRNLKKKSELEISRWSKGETLLMRNLSSQETDRAQQSKSSQSHRPGMSSGRWLGYLTCLMKSSNRNWKTTGNELRTLLLLTIPNLCPSSRSLSYLHRRDRESAIRGTWAKLILLLN